MEQANPKRCATCRWFVAGATGTVWLVADALFRGSTAGSYPANPALTRGKCTWQSPCVLPFWLWVRDDNRRMPIDGEDCDPWEPKAADAEKGK